MPWTRPLIIGFLVLLVLLAWWRLQPQGAELRRSQLMMGTVVEIVAGGSDDATLQTATTAAFAELARLEKLLSRYDADSEVSRLSRAPQGGDAVPDTLAVLTLGLDVARRSQGAFDLTLGRLKTLWDFDAETPAVPSDEAIAAALADIGPDALELDGHTVRKRAPGLMLDLGGIAKGYAVDRAIAVLKQHGVTRAAVNAGGDMYLLGQRPQRPWRIGIQHPRQADRVIATVQLHDQAVVTSGDYERFFEADGVRYHHIFDPQTGRPARGCQSVTVIAQSVALGDALATALFVLGPERGLELLTAYPGSEALIIAANGTQHPSPGWGNFLVAP